MKVPVCWGHLAVPSLGPGVGTGIASVFFTCPTPASRPRRAQGAPEGKWGGGHRRGEAAPLAEAAGHLPCSHTPAPSFWSLEPLLWRLQPVCCRRSLGPPCWSCWPGRCHGGPSGEGRPAGAAVDLGPVLWEQVGRRRDSPMRGHLEPGDSSPCVCKRRHGAWKGSRKWAAPRWCQPRSPLEAGAGVRVRLSGLTGPFFCVFPAQTGWASCRPARAPIPAGSFPGASARGSRCPW